MLYYESTVPVYPSMQSIYEKLNFLSLPDDYQDVSFMDSVFPQKRDTVSIFFYFLFVSVHFGYLQNVRKLNTTASNLMFKRLFILLFQLVLSHLLHMSIHIVQNNFREIKMK